MHRFLFAFNNYGALTSIVNIIRILHVYKYVDKFFRYLAVNKEAFLIKLGNNIRKLRLEAGFTQVELGLRLGRDKRAISRIEKGGHNPSAYILYEIAEVLKVDIKDLVDI